MVKKRQRKFLVVDVDKLMKQSYIDNYVNEEKNCLEIFEKYNIPREFQKILLLLKPFSMDVEFQEYMLGFPFNLKIVADKNDKTKKYIEGHNRYEIYNNLVMGNNISFRTNKKIVAEDIVKDFFKRLNELGYLPAYLQVIKDLFWGISLEEMLGIWNAHQSEDRQVKIREKKK